MFFLSINPRSSSLILLSNWAFPQKLSNIYLSADGVSTSLADWDCPGSLAKQVLAAWITTQLVNQVPDPSKHGISPLSHVLWAAKCPIHLWTSYFHHTSIPNTAKPAASHFLLLWLTPTSFHDLTDPSELSPSSPLQLRAWPQPAGSAPCFGCFILLP